GAYQCLHALPHDLAHPCVTHVSPLAVHAHARRTPPDQGPPCTCNPVPIRGADSARPAPRTAIGRVGRDLAACTPRRAGIRRAQRRPPAPATTTSAARAPCDSCTRSGTARSAARCPHAVPAQTDRKSTRLN